MELGDKFLYNFGWFGTSFGGIIEFLSGIDYSCYLTVVMHDKELWLREDNGCWFCPVAGVSDKLRKRLKLISKQAYENSTSL